MRAGLTALLAVVALAGEARAQVLEVGEGAGSYQLGGYLRAFSGLTYAPEALGAAADLERPTPQTVNLLRLEHRLSLGDRAGAEVHNRLAWVHGPQVGAVGVGVTPRPDRSADLRQSIVDGEDVSLDHDFDRGLVRLFLGAADVTLGRQGVTWGSSQLFTSADLWAPFSPYELDTTQKRGVDAARALFSPVGASELEVIVVDRGSAADLSGGAKFQVFGRRADGFFGAAKNWDQIVATGGARAEAGAWTLRAEGALPVRVIEADAGRDPETGIQPPRVTLGGTRFHGEWIAVVEAHYNGAGATDPDDYALRLSDPDFERGETFWLGRYYGGATLAWVPTLEWTLTAGGLVNIRDPSVLSLVSIEYERGESLALTGGYAGGFGASPDLAPPGAEAPLALGSEFGLFGQTGYLEVALFF